MNEKVDGIKQIEALIASDKLKEAYDLCNKLLLNFPGSYRLRKQKSKIEKLVFKQNLKLIKADMEKLKPLWKEERYEEIIKKLKALERFVPGYAPIEKELEKASKLLLKEKSKEQKNTLTKYISAAQKYMNSGDYKNAITTLKRILLKLPNHKQANKMLNDARSAYIDQQIKDRDFLLKSDKFEEIAAFIKHLKTIDPKSKKIDDLIKKLSKREKLEQKFAKMDFTYKSYEELLTLYQEGKYQPCIKGLEELLEIEKDNFKAMELLKIARSKFDKQLTKEVIDKIKKLQKKFKKQKKQMPHEFIRL